jgi:asparagine synthase (glutamine-hydrolysing)
MCGIAGAFGYRAGAPPLVAGELEAMGRRMILRGPDGEGTWISPDKRLGFVHRRLAIIDLSQDGLQPMSSLDGRFQIVFNGEIYNYESLRTSLIAQGARFKSRSDTEVLLELFARDGRQMCQSLRGMYTFAIFDTERRELFIARDPLGIKPLYLHDDGTTVRFASQVKALLAGGAIRDDPEPAGLVGYWIWGHVPEPWTPYKNVFSIQPGTWIHYSGNGRVERGEFQSLESLFSQAEGRDGQGSLRDALLDSVRHHLIADVPVGVFLSSGIDSTTLAALAAECGYPLKTVTLGFEEYRGTPADETPLAELVARKYGAEHRTVWIKRTDFERSLDQFVHDMDMPTMDGLNTWLVSRATASLGLKVAISGVGGDELFAGYPSFRHVPLMHRVARAFSFAPGLGTIVRRVTAPLFRAMTSGKYAGVLEYGGSWEGAYLLRRAARMPWELDTADGLDSRLVSEGLEKLFASRQEDKDLERIGDSRTVVSYLETSRYMRSQLLRDADWAGMAHSLEIRVPFVDVATIRYLTTQRAKGISYSKRDLAAAARPPLPGEIVARPKTGFTVPVRDWMLAAGQSDAGQRGQRAWQSAIARAYAQ